MPLYFEANQGQTDSAVQFLTRSHGYSLLITQGEVVLTLRQPDLFAKLLDWTTSETDFGMPPHDRRHWQQDNATLTSVIRTTFPGAAPTADLTVEGLDLLPGYSNYFIGNDPSKWRTNVPHYGRVRYRNLYPGIDLVLRGNPQQLEYDFVVAPGADPNAVRLAFTGTNGVAVDAEGNLVLQVAGGQLIQKAPKVYQVIDGVQHAVAGRYVLHAGEAHAQADFEAASPSVVGFQVAAYDRTQSLVIDPVLVYSTYLGGRNSDNGGGIAVDSAGHAYVTGDTLSVDFPTANPRDTSLNGNYDVFVAKLDTAGRNLVYSTYLGGSGHDYGDSIAVDSGGHAYVTGNTESADFPTANALDANFHGGMGSVGIRFCFGDAFVTKLDASGRSLVYSTYLGGRGGDCGYGIAVDSTGHAYVTGSTSSADFPTANALYMRIQG